VSARGLGPLLAVLSILAAGPAGAVSGGAEVPEDGTTVMVLSSKGGVCTGIVVAQAAVLTAAHCAAAGAEHRVHYREGGQPVLAEVAGRAVHPGYDAGAVAGRRRSIDLALLRLERPLPGRFRPATLAIDAPNAGASALLAGYGETAGGGPRSTGTLRALPLTVVEPYGPSRILLWLRAAAGASACRGDSGGPVSVDGSVAAVSAWSGGTCGSLVQGVRVGPQRGWIDGTLSGWGLSAVWR